MARPGWMLVPAVAGLLVLVGCHSVGGLEVERLGAEPDSVPRGGLAWVRCQVKGTARTVRIEWQANDGLVEPDTGDSVQYLAPDFDTEDTVFVSVREEQGTAIDTFVAIHVAEGLCGGLPDVLLRTDAGLLAADSQTVFYVEADAGTHEVGWVLVNGESHGVLASRAHEVRGLCLSQDAVLFLERDQTGVEPRFRVMRVSKDSGPVETVLDFGGLDSVIYDVRVAANRVYVTWLESVTDSFYCAHLTSFSLGGTGAKDHDTLWSGLTQAVLFGRMAAQGSAVAYLVSSVAGDRAEIRKYDSGSDQVQVLVDSSLLGPGTLRTDDGIAVAGNLVFWSEQDAGRVGTVGIDGLSPGFAVPAGGYADGVSLLAAGAQLSAPRFFWVVPDDLRGMIVGSGDFLSDLERGTGAIGALASNHAFLFFVRDDGSGSQLFRLGMP